MFRGVFRALTNIYDRVYYENSWRLLVVNYFCNKKCMKRSLTLSWRRSLSCRNQSAYLLCKSLDWFLYDRDRDLRHGRVNTPLMFSFSLIFSGAVPANIYLFKINNKNTRKNCEVRFFKANNKNTRTTS